MIPNAYPRYLIRLLLLLCVLCSNVRVRGSNPVWLFYTRAYQVNELIADSQAIWVGGYSGLARVDLASGQQTFINPSNSGLPSYRIDCMDRAADGTFWIGTDYGLARWDGVNWNVYDNTNSPVRIMQILEDVLADTAGSVWVAQNWLYHFDGTQWTTFDTANSPLREFEARRLYKALDGRLVVGCSSGDLFFFDGANWTVINPADSGYNSSMVQAIDQASDSSFWFSNAFGLYQYRNGSYTFFDNQNSPMPNQHVEKLRVDANDVVWMAVSEYFGPVCAPCIGGLQSFDGVQWVKYDTTNSDMPPLAQVALTLDAQGLPWVGGADGAIARLQYGVVTPLQVRNSGLSHPSIATLLVHRDGAVFAGGGFVYPFRYPGDLYRFDGLQWSGTDDRFTESALATAIGSQEALYIKRRTDLQRRINGTWDTLAWPLSGATIYYTDLHEMQVDASGRIWTDVIGYITSPGGSPVFHEGIARYDGSNWIVWCDTNSSLPDAPIHEILIDRNDRPWIVSNSLWYYDGSSWVQPPGTSGFTISNNTCLTEDSSGGIWLAIQDYGLARFDGSTWTVFPNSFGVGAGTYHDLAVAADQSVWAVSYSHVARFDGTSWRKYDRTNSPLDQQCTRVEADKYGNVWIGAPYGLFAHREGGVVLDLPESRVQDEFKLFNDPAAQQLRMSWQDAYRPVAASLVTPDGKVSVLQAPRASDRYELDYARLAAGVYFLRLQDAQARSRCVRFVVLR